MSRSSIQETVGVRSRLATWFSISCTVLLAIFLLASSTPASGQSYFGTVGGIVTDQTGAVLPGTEITLVDQEKGYKFHATTDNAGRYLFRAVSPGLYTVIADMAGFEKGERTNIRVNVTQNPTANLSLKVASGTETVEVKADAERLDQHDATTGLVVNRNFINDLPLLDRSVMDLTMLTPGVTTADDQCVGCGGTNFVSNGSRNATSDILMDGVSVTNMEPNGGVTEMTYAPSSEAVEEFRVEQSNFSAEYGFSGASVVNMITRSGTNSFHGSGYDFIRNNIGDANTWFNNYSGYSLPVVHRNNFGFTVGGPVWKNKTFFFFDYDAKRESGGGSYQAGVPSTAERAGDFGEVCTYFGGDFDSTGKCTVAQGQIWDPYTGVKGIYTDPEQGQITGAIRSNFIPYNNIATYTSPGNAKLKGTDYALSGGPGNLIDPAAKKMMSLFPSPTPNLNGATIYHNWYAVGSAHYPNDQFDVKIDHRLNQKNLISGKYSQQKSDNTSYNCFKNFADPCAGGPNWSNAHLFTINDVHTFSDKMLLTTTFGVTRGAMRVSNYNGMEADPLAELGMPEYLNSNGFTGVPGFSMGNYWSAGTEALGGNPWGNYKQGKTTGQVGASVSRVFGAHELKFGFEARQHIMNYIQTESPNGVFDSGTGGTSACPGTWENCGGDGMASFMMGQFSANYEIQMEPATEDRQYAGFVQENWKFSPKLTFNIGLRYDVTMPKTERFNRQNWFDKTAKSVNISGVGQAYGGDVFASSHQRRIVDTDWRDIQPRFGFAYQFTPKTTVRGGYGMYYSQSRAAPPV